MLTLVPRKYSFLKKRLPWVDYCSKYDKEIFKSYSIENVSGSLVEEQRLSLKPFDNQILHRLSLIDQHRQAWKIGPELPNHFNFSCSAAAFRMTLRQPKRC